MVNFPGDESLMICGPEQWELNFSDIEEHGKFGAFDLSEFMIEDEPRLASLLGVKKFIIPPPFIERGDKNLRLTIPSVRFPQWHYCPRCKILEKIELTRSGFPVCTNAACKKRRMIPLRFVAVCGDGHIQDVPLMEWVHRGSDIENEDHELYYRAGKGAGDLASIHIRCSCGSARSLGGIMGDDALVNTQSCQGHRPWLGPAGMKDSSCGNPLRVLIRGASNVYFPLIKSALYLPSAQNDAEKAATALLAKHGEQIRKFKDSDNDGSLLKIFLETHVKSDILETVFLKICEKMDGPTDGQDQEISEQGLRQQEYDYILRERKAGRDFKSSEIKKEECSDFKYISTTFDQVILVEQLKETRAFAGFSRIFPNDGNLEAKKSLLTNAPPLSWLPANQVYGEGIFLSFNEKLLLLWTELQEVQARALKRSRRYNQAIANRRADHEYRPLDGRFFLIHTLAHLMINRLCYNCGYGSSALRERIFCSSPDDDPSAMNGFLIYTSSGDSEGSLGGLVRQGKPWNLEKILRESVEDSRWCSADPVCMQVGSEDGQGPESVNGAACHNCAVIPETSCEEFNMLLDRAFVTGDGENPDLGFFSWLENKGMLSG